MGPTPTTPTTLHEGPCRVQYQAQQAGLGVNADQATVDRRVLIVVAREWAVPDDAQIIITAVDSNGPASLVGRRFTVTASQPSSLAAEQDLTCVDDRTNQPGGP